MTGEEIKVIPEEIAVCLSADMRGGMDIGSFLDACRLYLKQRRREQMESVREFYRRLGEGRARLTSCDYKLVESNADEEENWITVNGARVKIEKGQSKEEAVKPGFRSLKCFLRPERPTHNSPGQRRLRRRPGLRYKNIQPPCKGKGKALWHSGL